MVAHRYPLRLSVRSGSKIFGNELDVHAGGIDLKFPHHDNEIAQCNAAFGHENPQWPRYFLHTGHLHIKGHKMSKSLKNFITIKELLRDYSANQFRVFCLLHKYNSNVEFAADRMLDAQQVEARFTQFFDSIAHTLHQSRIKATQQQQQQQARKCLTQEHTSLWHSANESQMLVSASLACDFDTPAAMRALLEIVRLVNVHLARCGDGSAESAGIHVVPELLLQIGSYVRESLVNLGLDDASWPNLTDAYNGIHSLRATGAAWSQQQQQQQGVDVAALASSLVEFRSFVRQRAIGICKATDRQERAATAATELLHECDRLRDKALPHIGIQLKVPRCARKQGERMLVLVWTWSLSLADVQAWALGRVQDGKDGAVWKFVPPDGSTTNK